MLSSEASTQFSAGGDITVVAYASSAGNNGQIIIDSTAPITSGGGANSTNGSVTMVAGGKGVTAINIGNIDTTRGGANPTAAPITLQAAAPSNSIISFNQSAIPFGTPNVVNANPAASLTNSNVVTGTLTTSGGNINVFASANLQLGNIMSGNTQLLSNAGDVTLTAYGNTTLIVGAPTGSNYVGTINAAATNGGTNGAVSISNLDPSSSGPGGIVLSGAGVIANTGFTGGGSLTLIAGTHSNDFIDLGANSTLTYNASNIGATKANAGTVKLQAYEILWSGKGLGTNLTIDVNGDFNGSAGTIDYQTANTSGLTIDNTVGFRFSAKGSIENPNAGTISVQTGGNITYDPTSKAFNLTPEAGGDGGKLGLSAGWFNDAPINATSNLLVTGSINLDGNSSASGGSLTLRATSPTVFYIGNKVGNTNGVQGTISVAGGTAAAPLNGSITVESGGGITTTSAITAVDSLSFRSTGTGAITLGGALGTAPGTPGASSDVFLITDKGSILQPNKAFVVSADQVILQTGGDKTNHAFTIGTSKQAFVVNTGTLTASAGDTVNISAIGTAPGLEGNNGSLFGNFTLITTVAGGIFSTAGSRVLAAGNITMSAPTLNLTTDVIGTDAGTVTLTATTGDISIIGPLYGTKAIISAAKGSVGVGSIGDGPVPKPVLTITALNGIGSTGDITTSGVSVLKSTSTKAGGISLGGSLTANAPASTISVTTAFGNLTITGDASANKTLTLSAPKGKLDIGGIGAGSTGTVSLSALNNIKVGTGGILAVNSIVAKTTATTGARIEVSGDIKATNAAANTGVITLTTAGDIEMINTSKSIEATKSITITASKGTATLGSVGSASTGTVAVTSSSDMSIASATAINTVTLKSTTGGVSSAGNVLASSTSKGVVTINAADGVDLSGTDVSAGKTITITNTGNSRVSLGFLGVALTPLTASITSGGKISAGGTVQAVNTLTAKSTTKSVVADDGQLFFDGNVMTTSATAGAITLSSTGTGSAIMATGPNQISGTKSVTITATKGYVSVAQVGDSTNSPQTISITAFTGISAGSTTQAVKSITLKTTSTTAGDGEIQVYGDIMAKASTGVVTITSSSTTTPGITVQSPYDISAGSAVNLTAAKSSISIVSIGSGGARPTAKATITALTNITNSGAITVQSALSETVTGVNGTIVATGNLRVMPLIAPLTSGTIALTASQGSIDTSAADLTAGKSITLTALKGSGNITVGTVGATDATGTLVAKALHSFKNTGTINTVGAITVTTSAGNLVTDGVNLAGGMKTSAGGISITSGGTFLTVDPGVSVLATGTSKVKAPILLFNSNKSAGTITFGTGSSIVTDGVGGDKITVAVGTVPSKGTNLTNPNPTPGAIQVNHPGTGDAFFGPVGGVDSTSTGTINLQGADVIFNSTRPNGIKFTGTTFTADPPIVSASVPRITNTQSLINTAAINTSSIQTTQNNATTSNQIAVSDIATLVSQRGLIGGIDFNALNTSGNGYRWISATEIDGGEIPVSLLSDGDLAISGANVAQLHHSESGCQSHLDRGSVLSIAGKDRTITTAFGEVSIAANSMVLVMASQHGMSVYNFDDTHPNAVKVTAGGKSIIVRPGTSTTITAHHVKSFDHVNPAQLVLYRRLVEQSLDGNLKAFHNEFAVHSAIRAVRPLRDLLSAKDRETGKVANHFLKTTAILMGLQANGESFRQLLKPKLTASAL